jgi:RNase P subunit RPR2
VTRRSGERSSTRLTTRLADTSKTHCPNCNSIQRFPRKVDDDGKTMRVYVRCTMCRWEMTTWEGPRALYGLRNDVSRLRASSERRPVPAVQTRRLQERAQEIADDE